MTRPLIALTDKGVAVEFRYTENYQHKRMREHWRFDLVEALVDGQKAGYLRLAYIPSQAWQEHYSTCLDWMINANPGGRYKRMQELMQTDQTAWDHEHYFKLLRAMYPDHYWEERKIYAMPLDELSQLYEERAQRLVKEQTASWQVFKNAFVDKPALDYVAVYTKGDSYLCRDTDPPVMKRIEGEGFQRQGIATAMYEAAAMWMAERGMCIWADSIQEDAAIAVWKRLAQKHGLSVETRIGHRGPYETQFLDGSKIEMEMPALGNMGSAPKSASAEMAGASDRSFDMQ